MNKEFNCKFIEDLLLGYIEGTLNEETKKIVEKHLLECENCKNSLKDFKSSISESKNDDKKCIDYLKKAKFKEKMKVIRFIAMLVLLLLFIIYFYKLILFNTTLNTANENLKSNNIYIQKMEYLLNNEVSVIKRYYKDGKYKETQEMYTNNGNTLIYTKYVTVNSNESIYVDEVNKKVKIQKGENTKIQNSETNLKFVPFVNDNRFIFRVSCPAFMTINSKKFNLGSFSNENKECYVLNYAFGENKEWEIWLDKETGLPLKEINIDGLKSYYTDTFFNEEITQENVYNILEQQNDILKDSGDSITEYKYTFNIVKDEDIIIPNFSDYELEHTNF